ncbi:MAG: DUF2283 domain-containing protein [Candidatus Paceibacterota bacterium]|jgi:uncharacterized protein YuzE
MKFNYDKKEDILVIRFNEKKCAESDEVQPGVIFDYDSAGKIIAIEMLDARSRFPMGFSSKLKTGVFPVEVFA